MSTNPYQSPKNKPTDKTDQQPHVLLSIVRVVLLIVTIVVVWIVAALLGAFVLVMAAAHVPEPTYPGHMSSIAVAQTIASATILCAGAAGTFLAVSIRNNRRRR